MKKFNNINFPIFGYSYLLSFVYSLDKIITNVNGQTYIIDDRSIKEPYYLDRLLEIDRKKEYQRLPFDFTVRNIEELLKVSCKIAIDSFGKIYNFDKKELFIYSEKEIVKIYNSYFWVKNISYPYNIDLSKIENIEDFKKYNYAKVVYINKTWYFLGFVPHKTNRKEIWL